MQRLEGGKLLRGVYSATTDPQIILEWFEKDPRINIGVAMGGPLNLICVDIDPRNDGDATYSDLIDAHGEDTFPDTFTVRTGGGGWHRLYRLPEAIKPKAKRRGSRQNTNVRSPPAPASEMRNRFSTSWRGDYNT